MTTPQQARELAKNLRTKPTPLSVVVPVLQSLADQVEALTAQLDSYAMALNETKAERDSYKKDAERYRAIREGLEVDENSGIVVSLVDDFGGETLNGEVADNAIDAAIAKGTA